jgi:hypothetical protein
MGTLLRPMLTDCDTADAVRPSSSAGDNSDDGDDSDRTENNRCEVVQTGSAHLYFEAL